jgi:hypothetical protein
MFGQEGGMGWWKKWIKKRKKMKRRKRLRLARMRNIKDGTYFPVASAGVAMEPSTRVVALFR